MKVLWMSRHQPLQSQVDELKRVLGDCEVVQDPNPFEDASDIYIISLAKKKYMR